MDAVTTHDEFQTVVLPQASSNNFCVADIHSLLLRGAWVMKVRFMALMWFLLALPAAAKEIAGPILSRSSNMYGLQSSGSELFWIEQLGSYQHAFVFRSELDGSNARYFAGPGVSNLTIYKNSVYYHGYVEDRLAILKVDSSSETPPAVIAYLPSQFERSYDWHANRDYLIGITNKGEINTLWKIHIATGEISELLRMASDASASWVDEKFVYIVEPYGPFNEIRRINIETGAFKAISDRTEAAIPHLMESAGQFWWGFSEGYHSFVYSLPKRGGRVEERSYLNEEVSFSYRSNRHPIVVWNGRVYGYRLDFDETSARGNVSLVGLDGTVGKFVSDDLAA